MLCQKIPADQKPKDSHVHLFLMAGRRLIISGIQLLTIIIIYGSAIPGIPQSTPDNILISCRTLQHLFQCCLFQIIIAIKKQDKFSSALAGSGIACCRHTCPLFCQFKDRNRKRNLFTAKPVHGFLAAVVTDDYCLKIPAGLFLQAVKAVIYIYFLINIRNYDTNFQCSSLFHIVPYLTCQIPPQPLSCWRCHPPSRSTFHKIHHIFLCICLQPLAVSGWNPRSLLW